jgi:hypothetical protein
MKTRALLKTTPFCLAVLVVSLLSGCDTPNSSGGFFDGFDVGALETRYYGVRGIAYQRTFSSGESVLLRIFNNGQKTVSTKLINTSTGDVILDGPVELPNGSTIWDSVQKLTPGSYSWIGMSGSKSAVFNFQVLP